MPASVLSWHANSQAHCTGGHCHVMAIQISSIKEKCMRIDVDVTHVYVCHIPNSFEKD